MWSNYCALYILYYFDRLEHWVDSVLGQEILVVSLQVRIGQVLEIDWLRLSPSIFPSPMCKMTMQIKDNGKYEWRKEQYETAAEELGENTKSKGIDQQDGDELDQEERVEKVRLGVTRAAMQRQRNIAESGVTDIQELFNGAIDEETASQLMDGATDAAGFDIVEAIGGDEKLRVNRTEIDLAIQTVASSPPEAIPESAVATEGEDDDGDETDPHDEPGKPDDHAAEEREENEDGDGSAAGEIEEQAARVVMADGGSVCPYGHPDCEGAQGGRERPVLYYDCWDVWASNDD